MKRILLIILLIGIIFPIFTEEIFAGNSASVSISCVIPEIPGVNLPLVEEKITDMAMNNLQTESLASGPLMFEKETEEIRLRQGEKITVSLSTIYSR
jgi:hypothetical protein